MPKGELPEARRERAGHIIKRLEEQYPHAKIALEFETPFQLLIATILAAQCTDLRVNTVTPGLFKRFPTPQSVLEAPVEELEKMIFSTGFYRNKAKAIRGVCAMLIERSGGEVPRTIDELVALPGVGRKTANVLLGHCFDVPGIVVDTHVKRISNLLELVSSDDPEKIEIELMDVIPADKWVRFSHLLAEHGRAICVARRPRCAECPISEYCPSSLDPLPDPPQSPSL